MPCLSVYRKTSKKVLWCFQASSEAAQNMSIFPFSCFLLGYFFFYIKFGAYRELINCWSTLLSKCGLHSVCDRDVCVCVWAVYEPSMYTIMLQNYFYRGSKTVCLLDCGELQRSLQSLCCEWYPLQSWEPQKRLENPCEIVSNFAYIWLEKIEQCIHRFHLNLPELCREGVTTCSLLVAFDAALLAVSELKNSSFPFWALYSIL